MTFSKMGRNHDIASVSRAILKEKPDILFIQEISDSDVYALKDILSKSYTTRLFFYNDKHIGLILSSYPIVTHETDGSKISSIIIEMPERKIRVWNVHLKKSFFSTTKQYKAVEEMADQVSNETLPIIIAGDFNATGINYPCKLLKKHLKDAFEESGFGFGFTFPSSVRRLGLLTPFIRIDHIFFSTHFNSHSTYVAADNGGADHYPVVTLLSFKN
ncbi:MAG: endonuclease/exonuclease/phosphatase family protein [Methylococcales bacterium]|nr:endonuclease/exonuclease/phosphatase family protein [Methylococcales bacterium]